MNKTTEVNASFASLCCYSNEVRNIRIYMIQETAPWLKLK